MSTAEQKIMLPTLRAGSAAVGIVPTTFDDCYRLAKCAVASGLVPKDYKDKPEAATMAIMHGLELGLPPMQALECIAIINGRRCLWGDAIPALLWARGFKLTESMEGEGEKRKAVCLVTRPDGTQVRGEFSVAEAKKAGLWGKAGPWASYSERMLKMRARGFAARDGGADVLRGVAIAEEQADVNLTRDEYSEIKVAPKKAFELPEIPDEPAKEAAAKPANGQAQQGEQAAENPAKPDAQFLEDIEAAFAAAKDMDSLNEVLVHNETATEERDLRLAVGDKYQKHKVRIYDGMT